MSRVGSGIGTIDMEIFPNIIEFLNTGIVLKSIVLTALVIIGWKIQGFLKKRAFRSSKKQAHDDTVEMKSDNQSKDSTQSEDAKSLDTWIERIRHGRASRKSD